jgi:Glycosyltransferase family 10 (fucosyltransferase) C-term
MKKINIIIGFIIILIVLLILLVLIPRAKEKFNNNINVHNWWDDGEASKSSIRDLINTDKDIEVYGPFGSAPDINKDDGKLYVQMSGESYYHDINKFHINLIPYEKETKTVIPYPYAASLIGLYDLNKFLNKRTLNTDKNGFCLFAVSNGGCEQRNNFFNKLSQYKKVDSCGNVMNNMGQKCPSGWLSPEYYDFINNYKFMICFENKSVPNYLTEKLLNAYYSGTIPIYWGCPNVSDYVNMDSILYLKPEHTDNDVDNLIKEIIYLDNDPEAYKKKFEAVFFKDGKLPDAFNSDVIKSKIKKILDDLN